MSAQPMLIVHQPGLLTTVQDLGRQGWRQSGVGQSGALDYPALVLANLLAGNPPHSAVLEITLGQAEFSVSQDGWFAVTGADCHATLDGQPVWPGWRLPIKAGARLKFGAPRHGMRGYLAIAGGIDLPTELGSRSTHLNAGFGGLAGRALQAQDTLPLGVPSRRLTRSLGIRLPAIHPVVRALPGPEYTSFTPAAQAAFWSTAWQVSSQSNRMGSRLQGPVLTRSTPHELLSHGVLPGVVQVPPNGQPILLLADAQTTGGYPRIACVIETDLHQLAQCRFGSALHFSQCTLEEAWQARQQLQQQLRQLAWRLDYPHPEEILP